MNSITARCRALRAGLALLILAPAGHAGPLDTWTLRNPLPTEISLWGAAYGNGQFAAVGDGILTSADGVSWVRRVPGEFIPCSSLTGIAYGSGLFVAVGGCDVALTSTNGEDWELHQSQAQSLYSICYGNSLFVAIGFSTNQNVNTIFTSTDGVNWIQRQSGTTNGLSTVIYGNGLFVAVGGHTYGDLDGDLVTSPDGVNWVQRQSGPNLPLGSVAYGDGLFVAGGLGMALTSTNGINWAQHQLDFSPGPISYGGGLFVSVSYGDIFTSRDGATWVHQRSLSSDSLSAVSYGGGLFVAVGSAGSIVTSADGVTWDLRQPGTVHSLGAIIFANDQFVTVGQASAVLTSTNAVNWVPQSGGIGDVWLNGIAYGQGRFVASGSGLDGHIADFVTTPNGVIWGQDTALVGGPEVYGVSFGGGQFVAVGEFGNLQTSTDGVNWNWPGSTLNPPTTNSLRGITYANHQFVAVGDSGTTITSTDGTNWVQRRSGTTIGVNGIASGRELLVAVGGDHPHPTIDYQLTESIILASSNAVDWVPCQLGTTNILNAVAYGNGEFVTVGAMGTLLSSTDGINWTARQSGTQNDLWGVSYGDGHFVVVGDNGTILESGSIISLALAPNASSGGLMLSLTGPTGLAYTIEQSNDLVSWQSLTNIISTQSTEIIFDSLRTAGDRAFYRAYSQ